MKRAALFAFQGDLTCFVHVMLNALDLHERGWEVKIVIEGQATKLIPDLAKEGNPLHQLYQRAREKGLIEGACKACSLKMGTLEDIRAQGVALLSEMSGHPPMGVYMDRGYVVITF